jgi:ABC-2 type transport system ATP-binding protein
VLHAVRGVDIAIAPGETVALLGPNGAGKSTTIDMLLGLLASDTGSVALFGMTPRLTLWPRPCPPAGSSS